MGVQIIRDSERTHRSDPGSTSLAPTLAPSSWDRRTAIGLQAAAGNAAVAALFRSKSQPAVQRSAGDPPAPPLGPEELGKMLEAKAQPLSTGKRATIAQGVNGAKFSQADAARATEVASRVFGRVGPVTTLPDGRVVVPSVAQGVGQPVFIIHAVGTVQFRRPNRISDATRWRAARDVRVAHRDRASAAGPSHCRDKANWRGISAGGRQGRWAGGGRQHGGSGPACKPPRRHSGFRCDSERAVLATP